MVGGGVRGKDIGIAHTTTTQVGNTIKAFHPFIEGYLHTGGRITGITVGEGIAGTTNEYITNKLSKTGEVGNRVGIGRSNKLGVSKVCKPERNRSSNRENMDNTKGVKHSNRSSNRENMDNTKEVKHSNRSSNRENMEGGEKKNRIEDRLEEIISEKKSIPAIRREVKKEAVKKT
jgi:hypothetical protein